MWHDNKIREVNVQPTINAHPWQHRYARPPGIYTSHTEATRYIRYGKRTILYHYVFLICVVILVLLTIRQKQYVEENRAKHNNSGQTPT